MTKITFGQFLAQCRIQKGLTQKELADLLFVGESAVSKWENNKRQPGLELVSKLSEIFGITESELIRASINTETAKNKKEAHHYRIIKNTYKAILLSGFSIALLVCFIVNLAVSHTLSWFWIVLAALTIAFIVLLLPLYIKKHKLLIIPLSWLGSIYLLLTIICLYTNGNWLVIPLVSLLLSFSMIFTPIYINYYLPNKYKEHNAILSISIDMLILNCLLITIDAYQALTAKDFFGFSFRYGIPIVLYWYICLLAMILFTKYVKLNRYFLIGINSLFFATVTTLFPYVFLYLLGIERTENQKINLNLTVWNETTISSNVNFLVLLFFVIVFITFSVIGFIKHIKTKITDGLLNI